MSDTTPPTALKRTPLHDLHVALGAKMVPFAGYERADAAAPAPAPAAAAAPKPSKAASSEDDSEEGLPF